MTITEEMYYFNNMGKIRRGRGFGKVKGKTPEPMEPHCRVTMIRIVMYSSEESDFSMCLGWMSDIPGTVHTNLVSFWCTHLK